MTSLMTKSETYLPGAAVSEELAALGEYLEAVLAGRTGEPPRVFLSGAATGEVIEVPQDLYRVMRQVVNALRHGMAVTVAPQDTALTTQEAADLLGISRPTLIKLLETGELDHGLVGTHRRVALRDVLAYRDRRRAGQHAAIAAMSDPHEPDPTNPTAGVAAAKAARKKAMDRRRAAAEQDSD